MALQVVGSGLGRTGTASLKAALELLLGGPCYHMFECFGRPDDIPVWRSALAGDDVDWQGFLADYVASVDWPAAAFWKELAAANPEALVLHSERPADDWFRSADATIFHSIKDAGAAERKDPWIKMIRTLFGRITDDILDRDAAMAGFEAWNADVRASAPADRLLIWHPGDGWEPICDALDLPVPDQPFPHTNSTEDFRRMMAGGDA